MDVRSTSDIGHRSWLDRLTYALTGEPRDRGQVVELLRDAQKRDLLDVESLGMIEGVFQVSEMRVRDIMVPRSQMVVVPRHGTLAEMLPTIIESGHSRFPVIGDSRDEVLGILLAKDLLRYTADSKAPALDLQDILRSPVFIPQSKRLNELLKEFRHRRNHLAIVVNEYGGVAGMVTIEDVLEQIVGDIDDEHDIDEENDNIRRHTEKRFSVRALTPIEEFDQYFGTHFGDDEFDTIGGLVMSRFAHVPKRGEEVMVGSFRFKVLRADNRRVHLLQLTIGLQTAGREAS